MYYLSAKRGSVPGLVWSASDYSSNSRKCRRDTAQQRATAESPEQLLGAAGQTEWQAHADCFELGMLGAGTSPSVLSYRTGEVFSYLTPGGKVSVMVTAGIQRGLIWAQGQQARIWSWHVISSLFLLLQGNCTKDCFQL